MSLYTHFAHPHVLKNVNELQKTEQTNLNARIGVFLTKHIGTMWAAYSFMVLAIVGFFAIIGVLPPTVALLVAWASQTFIQLVMLPVIMVGQNVLGRKAELQSDEMFATSQHSFSDIVQIMEHLDAQDQEILKIVKQLEILVEARKQESLLRVSAR